MEEVNFGDLKRVTFAARFEKSFEVNHYLDAHRAVGWAYGALKMFLSRYGKHLYDIRKISVDNTNGKCVKVLVVVDLGRITCGDAAAHAKDMIEVSRNLLVKYDGWHWNTPESEPWDSVEMVGEPVVSTGADTGVMVFRKE